MMDNVISYAKEDVGFYPTPPELVKKMLSDIDWSSTSSVLEPSAGTGNIVYGVLDSVYDHFREYGYSESTFNHLSIDCIELDPNLRGVLDYTFMGKKAAECDDKKLCKLYDSNCVRIVGDDFLDFITYRRYDLIAMNPPFEFGAEHLLRAISIQEEHGGGIVCILNAETLKNPYSNIRKILGSKLDKHEAKIEYIQNAFSYAERETEEVNLLTALEAAKNRCVSKKIPCKYFNVTFFKKGTCHIEFNNTRLLDKLNIFGSQRKNWLPPCYGKKHYAEMSDEEKTVIDEFQGAEGYEAVLGESAYYLADYIQPLLLGKQK